MNSTLWPFDSGLSNSVLFLSLLSTPSSLPPHPPPWQCDPRLREPAPDKPSLRALLPAQQQQLHFKEINLTPTGRARNTTRSQVGRPLYLIVYTETNRHGFTLSPAPLTLWSERGPTCSLSTLKVFSLLKRNEEDTSDVRRNSREFKREKLFLTLTEYFWAVLATSSLKGPSSTNRHTPPVLLPWFI